MNTTAIGAGNTGSSGAYAPEGYQEISVKSPLLPFGPIHAEKLLPIFQSDAVYGTNDYEQICTTGINGPGLTSGSCDGSSNLFTVATGTTALSFATLQSRRRLRYRPGQGIVGLFTALFPANAEDSTLVAGLGTAEAGVFVGYNGTSFGILHSTGGVREIQTLTITTPSTTAENITITLAGVAYSVPVTNSGSANKTAYEIASFDYSLSGWRAEQIDGGVVVFLAGSAGDKTGTFSLSGATTAVGSFVETTAGVAPTNTWVPQSSWNGADKLDGAGPSGGTLNPAVGNVYKIGIQYLGFGAITVEIEIAPGNFVLVHTFEFANSRVLVTLSQPALPFTMAAYSSGSTTNLTVQCASFAGFVAGEKKAIGPRQVYYAETNGFVQSAAGAYYPLLTIRNDSVYRGRANQTVINIKTMGIAHDDATPITFFLLRNAALAGSPTFLPKAPDSCAHWDTAATLCTIVDEDQLIEAIPTGQNAGGEISFEDEITIQPGETMTLAARAATGTATYVNGTVNTREDQ